MTKPKTLREKRTAPWRKTPARVRPGLEGKHPKSKKGVTVEEIEQALWASGALLADAARMLGITRSTLDARVKRNAKLTALTKEIREDLTDFAESKLMDAMKKGNLGALCFYLRTQGRHRGYVEKQEIETSTAEPIKIYLPQKAELPDDEPLETMSPAPAEPAPPEAPPGETSEESGEG